MEREVGGGIGMGNTCKPTAVSFQCMTKSTTIKKKKAVIAINLNFKNKLILHDSWASPIAQLVKNVPEMQETRFDSRVRKFP